MVTLFQTIIYILYEAEDKTLFQDIQQKPRTNSNEGNTGKWPGLGNGIRVVSPWFPFLCAGITGLSTTSCSRCAGG